MRISTLSLQQQGLAALLDQQSNLARTQLEVATGRRILTPSDDPIGAAQILSLQETISQLDQFQTNSDIATNRLSLEESTLNQISNVLQRVRELTIQASNDTQTPETRAIIATEIEQLGEQLFSLSNAKNGEGEYLFAGFRTNTQPFTRSGGVVLYNGDQGQRFLQVGLNQQVRDGDNGAELFQFIPSGNGTFTTQATPTNTGTGVIATGGLTDPAAFVPDIYSIQFLSPTDYQVTDSGGAVVQTGTYSEGETIEFLGAQVNISGQPDTGDSFAVSPSINRPIFATLDALVADLQQFDNTESGRALLRSDINAAIDGIDQSLGRILETRTTIGSRLSLVENQRSLNQELDLQFRETLSDIQDVDFAEAVTRLNSQLAGLEAAQQAFVRVQGLSLFNFL